MRLLTSALAATCLALAFSASTGADASPTQAAPTAATTASIAGRVDAVFSRWTEETPGCAVGVGVNGKSLLARGYGMADLEHDVRITPETIFEAGSVAKQFTAAAILLLAKDGRLSIDDPVHKYVPELADYGAPITIRQMLTHTSGLRDWGSVAGIAGWPRGNRMHTHADVVDILSRQRALNFAPGTRWSYSNSGYNLAAIIVARVAGKSFAEFSRERIFAPLGMAHTSWRDDYARIVKRRAIAYAAGGGGLRQDMPFENVHGNGGLLTTVGDLLTWNEHFVSSPIADAALLSLQQTPARLGDGRALHYAFGLFVQPYKGLPEVSHSGSTAGYRAFLTRFPEQHLSVAVLCNAGSANPTAYAHAVADLYLRDRLKPGAPAPATLPETRGPTAALARDETFRPSPADLAAYAGTFTSDEAETTLRVEVRGDALVVLRRPDTAIPLRPHSRDRFDAGSLGLVTFHRESGRVTALSVTQDRVWDLRFEK
jgi:CubicO group peptidase (beta-lactamase class C family)